MKHISMGAVVLAATALGGCFTDTAGPAPGADTCGAQSSAAQVGAPLPKGFAARDPARVFRSGDALTMDFVAGRINIELDPQTGKVVRVFCG